MSTNKATAPLALAAFYSAMAITPPAKADTAMMLLSLGSDDTHTTLTNRLIRNPDADTVTAAIDAKTITRFQAPHIERCRKGIDTASQLPLTPDIRMAFTACLEREQRAHVDTAANVEEALQRGLPTKLSPYFEYCRENPVVHEFVNRALAVTTISATRCAERDWANNTLLYGFGGVALTIAGIAGFASLALRRRNASKPTLTA